uniref:Putative secreted protein n=1 Tax=Anopheles darlingi TaxID=43151 RepID=A0A2M4DIJ9_ANODA
MIDPNTFYRVSPEAYQLIFFLFSLLFLFLSHTFTHTHTHTLFMYFQIRHLHHSGVPLLLHHKNHCCYIIVFPLERVYI